MMTTDDNQSLSHYHSSVEHTDQTLLLRHREQARDEVDISEVKPVTVSFTRSLTK